ncbi:hypothetical protein [Xenophilus azovorans]|uniref:hypothetical protein n=1 Tax=Xenophilus azovorans TaxID=151755 RepID=UPI0012ED18B3|nr:hypothetical protein [Xenophilus azovorans]
MSNKRIASPIDPLRVQRAVTCVVLGSRVAAVALVVAGAASPALAQTLRQTGVNFFNVIYGIVGVVGAIMGLLTLLNWTTGNWLGREDPKRTFMQVLFATGLAFAIVAIIQFIKETVGSSSSGISNL